MGRCQARCALSTCGRRWLWIPLLAAVGLAGLGAWQGVDSGGLRAQVFVGAAALATRTDTHVEQARGRRDRAFLHRHLSAEQERGLREEPGYRVRWTGTLQVPAESSAAGPRRPGLLRHAYARRAGLRRPFRSGVVATPAEGGLPGRATVELWGALEIPLTGEYRFRVRGERGVWLTLGGRLVGRELGRLAVGPVALEAGHHEFLIHSEGEGEVSSLEVEWRVPGARAWAAIPEARFSHAPAPGRALYVLGEREWVRARLTLSPEHGPPQVVSGERAWARLVPGNYALELEATFTRPAGLQLRWRDGLGVSSVVPERALTPPEGKSLRLRALLPVAFLGLLALALTRAGARRWVRRHRVALALALVLAGGAWVRGSDHDVVPHKLETIDEYNNAWIGYGLLAGEGPLGMHMTDMPRKRGAVASRWDGVGYVAEPMLHPPPLLPLLAGGAAHLSGASDRFGIRLHVIRLVPLALSLFAAGLLFVLARNLYGLRVAFLASLLYATTPLIVLSARLVKEESLLTVLLLGALIATERYLRRPRPALLAGAALCCGLAFLTKQTGICVTAMCALTLVAERRERAAAVLCGGAAALSALYFLYAWALDWEAFARTTRYHADLSVGFSAFLQLLSEGKVTHREWGSGWLIWLWLTVLGLRSRWRRLSYLVPLALLLCVFLTAASVRVNGVYGWYRIPLYPLLCLAGGVSLRDAFRDPDLLRPALFVGVALYSSLDLVSGASPWLLRALLLSFLIFFLPGVLRPSTDSRALYRAGLATALTLFVLLNLWIGLHLETAYDGHALLSPLR